MGSFPRAVRSSGRHGQTSFEGGSIPSGLCGYRSEWNCRHFSFDIDPNGATANLHVEKSSNPALESEITGIVRGWRFQPAVRNGEPVSVRCTMEFVKGNGNTRR
jgi:TonB family protein